MEVTFGVLNSMVQTKSIERILAPIASQVSLFTILDETNWESSLPTNMNVCVDALLKMSKKIAKLGREKSAKSSDQEYKSQMQDACEMLDLAGSDLFLASERYSANNSQEIRTKMVQATKDVLQSTMKVLLVSDGTEIKIILAAAQVVTENIERLNAVGSMPQLLAEFKSFTDSVTHFCGLVNKRQKDLCHERQREKIITSMTLLKQSIPSLSVALQTYVKYSSNPQAQTGKSCALKQVLMAVNDITSTIENKLTEEDYLEVEEPGSFVTKIDQILESLTDDCRGDLNVDLESWVESVVRHSMLVAHMCLDHHRDVIVQSCHQILQVKSKIVDLNESLQTATEIEKIKEEYDESCEAVIDELCELEKNVNLALLHLMIDTFKETTEPLERLAKSAMETAQMGFEVEEWSETCSLEFEAHADKMCQVASCAAASSTDSKRVRKIRTCVCHMERLDPDITPAAIAMATDGCTKMTVKQLKHLMNEWSFEVRNLVQVLDEMTDPFLFMQVSENKIKEDVATCRGFVLSHDTDGLSRMLKSVVGRCNRVCQVAERIVDHSAEPLFRNGLVAYIRQLERTIRGVRAAGGNCILDIHNGSFVDTLYRRFKQLQDCVGQVRAGLSEVNHPDILSPLRRKARQQQAIEDNKRRQLQDSGFATMMSSTSRSRLSTNRFISLDSASSLQDHFVKQEGQLTASVAKQQHCQEKDSSSKNKGQCYASLIGSKLYAVSVRGDKQRTNAVSGFFLGWTNHIIDAAQMILPHCEDEAKKKSVKQACDEVDSLVSDVLDAAKAVVSGDTSETAKLSSLAEEWTQKIEKVRVFVDITVETWKEVTNRIHEAVLKSNTDNLAIEVEDLRCHQNYVGELLDLMKGFQGDPLVRNSDLLERLIEEKDEFDSITVTLITSAEMVVKSGTSEEKQQVEELGRDWSVKVFCILPSIRKCIAPIFSLGQNSQVRQNDAADAELEQNMGEESLVLKSLLHGAVIGDKLKVTKARELYEQISNVHSKLRLTINQKQSKDQGSVIRRKYYFTAMIEVLSALWRLQVIHCISLVDSQITTYTAAITKLTDAIYEAKQCAKDSEKQMNLAVVQEDLSHFSRRLVSVRQKVLQGIQVSSELEKRAIIRKCVDNITNLGPGVIKSLKTLADGKDPETLESFSQVKRKWGCGVRHLLISLLQMKDLKQSLVKEIGRLLGITELEDNVDLCCNLDIEASNQQLSNSDQHQEQATVEENIISTQSVKAISAQPSGAKSFSLLDEDREKLKPIGSILGQVHKELLQVTRSRNNDLEIGEVASSGWGDKNIQHQPSSQTLGAARFLQKEADRWEDDCNPIVQIAKEMAQYLESILLFAQGKGPITSKKQMLDAAKSVAENGKKMRKFAQILAKHCIDSEFSKDLLFYADQIPTISTQLSIIARVQEGSSDDKNEGSPITREQANKIIVQNAQNLMKVAMQTIKAAEAVCVKGLEMPENGTPDDINAVILATQWRRKFLVHLQQECDDAPKDELGLRRIEEHRPPELTQIFKLDQSSVGHES